MPPCTMPSELAWRFSGRKPRISRSPSAFSNHGPFASAKPATSISLNPGGMDTRHLRRSGDSRQQNQAVADIVGGDRRDQAVRPDAELPIAQPLEQQLAQRRADHRRGDGGGEEPRLDVARLL